MIDQRDLKDQKKLIENTNWDNLIIFDACRYDSFEKIYPEYLRGDLIKVHNRGISYTYDWFKEIFDGRYPDTILYTAAPIAIWKWKDKEEGDYDPKNHFGDIPDWRDCDWDYEKGTTTPRKIIEFSRQHRWKGKKIYRFLEPHPPFPDMPWTKGGGKMNRGWNMLKEGEITLEEIREGYENNLRIAFEGVIELNPTLDEKTVITSDHGTCLGDCGQLFHARGFVNHPHLVEVPWFEVESK